MTHTTMKAIQLRAPGGPEVLELVDLPMPEPGPGTVRVKAHAMGAGGPDVLIRNGTYKWMPPMPAIPGNEMAGVVNAIGPGVRELVVGQRVLVSARELPQRGGCYAEYICVPAAAPFALPDSVSFDDAVSLGNFQLALALLASNGNLPARSILVPGAAGGVATALVQAAVGGIGLWIAGVPFAALLTALMFLLAVAQVGAAPVLVCATVWLYWSGSAGWGTFLLVVAVVAGGLDNVLRPILIRQGAADLPLLLIFVGVIGGLLAFGLIGIFVGPVVLAVTHTLLRAWLYGETTQSTK